MFSVAVATVLLPVAGAARHARGHGGLPATVSRRAAADQLPARPGGVGLDRARRADRAAALRARRLRAGPDDRRRRRARRVLDRAHLQRDDADAEPRLLQPAVALGADARRARRISVLNAALYFVALPRRHVGHPARDLAREHRGRRAALRRCCGAGSAGSTCRRRRRSFLLVVPRLGRARRRLVRRLVGARRGARPLLPRRSSSRSEPRSPSAAASTSSPAARSGCREIATLLSLRDRFRRD